MWATATRIACICKIHSAALEHVIIVLSRQKKKITIYSSDWPMILFKTNFVIFFLFIYVNIRFYQK